MDRTALILPGLRLCRANLPDLGRLAEAAQLVDAVLITGDLFADALVDPAVVRAAGEVLTELAPRVIVVVAGPADPVRPGCALLRLSAPPHVNVITQPSVVDLGWLLVHACPAHRRVADPLTAARPVPGRLQVGLAAHGGARAAGFDAVLVDDGSFSTLTLRDGALHRAAGTPWNTSAAPGAPTPPPTPPAPPPGFVAEGLAALTRSTDPDAPAALAAWARLGTQA